MLNNEGLYSINILLESDAYDDIVNKCKSSLKEIQNQS
jgi:hypothetical protein